MRRISFLAGLFWILVSLSPCRALDTDIYVLSNAEVQVHPDALIILDLSSSMWWTPAGDTMYIGSGVSCGSPCNSANVASNVPFYNDSATGRKAVTVGSSSSASPRYSNTACTGPFYRSSQTGYATDCSRVAIAKRAIKYVLDDNDDGTVNSDDEVSLGIRFGYMRYKDGDDTSGNYSSGNIRLMSPLNTSYSTILTSVNSESANGGTPLASSLNEARLYFNYHKSQDNAAACRQKFVILITDGDDTYACNGNGQSSQTDQYKRRRETVAKAKAIADAGYRVFVVGFGATMPHHLKNTLNWAAYYGGTDNPMTTKSGNTSGYNPAAVTSCQTSSTTHHNIDGDGDHYYATTNDPAEASLSGYAFLAESSQDLSDAIKNIAKYIIELLKKSTSYVAPVVPISQMEKTSAGNRLYLGMFKPASKSFWKGNIKKYGIATADSGNIKTGDIVDVNGSLVMNTVNRIKDTARSYWSTSADGEEVESGGVGQLLLERSTARNIYTYLGSNANLTTSGNAFKTANAAITPTVLGLTSSDTAGRDKVINFIHGYDTYDENSNANTTEKRSWILGAFIHSRPLIVAYSDRTVIYAGANDGMLHAFDDATGEELWAFVPPNLLPRLKDLNGEVIEFFVDGTPKIYNNSTLIFGQRRGGNRYIALDVSDPLTPRLLWEISPATTGFSELGQTWSTPQLGKVKYGSGDKVVAFFAAGYDINQDNIPVTAADTRGRAVYAIDIATGALLWKYSFAENSDMRYSIPSDIARVDTDGNGKIDRLYVGDTGGRMWRFDLSSGSTAEWTGKKLFTGTGKIFYPPDVTLEKDEGNYELLFFGTGDREAPKDVTAINSLYAVKDKNPSTALTESDLYNVTQDRLQADDASDEEKSTILAALKEKKGWYIRLVDGAGNAKGEKCLSSPVVYYGVVYYTTFTPTFGGTDEICYLGEGMGRLFAMRYTDGTAVFNLDATNDLEGTVLTRSDRSKVIGAAIPSSAVITIVGTKATGYVGVGGGVYLPELLKTRPLVPLSWKGCL
jgi:type IV pilus assembly protein PilY1